MLIEIGNIIIRFMRIAQLIWSNQNAVNFLSAGIMSMSKEPNFYNCWFKYITFGQVSCKCMVIRTIWRILKRRMARSSIQRCMVRKNDNLLTSLFCLVHFLFNKVQLFLMPLVSILNCNAFQWSATLLDFDSLIVTDTIRACNGWWQRYVGPKCCTNESYRTLVYMRFTIQIMNIGKWVANFFDKSLGRKIFWIIKFVIACHKINMFKFFWDLLQKFFETWFTWFSNVTTQTQNICILWHQLVDVDSSVTK
jgi:hypothetical protein